MFLFLYFLVVGWVTLLLQMNLPVTFPLLAPCGIAAGLLPLIVIYSSLEMADERGPLLAIILGLLLDLASGRELGTSVLILGAISLLITSQADKDIARGISFQLVCSLVGTFVFLSLDYAANLMHTRDWQDWNWPLSVWNQITFACLFNLVFTLLLFPLLRIVPSRLGLGLASQRQMVQRRYV